MKLQVTQQNDFQLFYGHGKLLITGEYFVLDGAQALAIPTKFGQVLRVKKLHSIGNVLYWVALNSKKQVWLNLVFDTTDFRCVSSEQEEGKILSKILSEARKQNPQFLTDGKDRAVETRLEFPNEWGLGSSSSLLHCISKWAVIDGYELLKNTIDGSGYDVVCAASTSAILYQLQNDIPKVLSVNWRPLFFERLYFVYTGKKQISRDGIKHYRKNLSDKTCVINNLTRITGSLLRCDTLQMFEELIDEHETIVGEFLKMIKTKDSLFPDYWGSVKSLGAWGGDFVMMTNDRREKDLKDYLAKKNFSTVFKWNEIILAANSQHSNRNA